MELNFGEGDRIISSTKDLSGTLMILILYKEWVLGGLNNMLLYSQSEGFIINNRISCKFVVVL